MFYRKKQWKFTRELRVSQTIPNLTTSARYDITVKAAKINYFFQKSKYQRGVDNHETEKNCITYY